MEANAYNRALMEKQNGFIKNKISKGSVGMNTLKNPKKSNQPPSTLGALSVIAGEP